MSRFSGLLLLLLLPGAWAQTTSPPELQPRPSPPANANNAGSQITLDVRVTNKSGAVRGLQGGDFFILVDKRPQTITSFAVVDRNATAAPAPPVEVMLVVDGINASFSAVSRARGQLRDFLLQNGGQLAEPVSIALVSEGQLQVQSRATRDGNALAAAFDQYTTALRSSHRSAGFYGAQDRLNFSLNALISLIAAEKAKPGRKLMIWISPGWPLLSGPRELLSPKMEHQLFDQVVAISAEIRQAQVTLYMVDPLGLADAGSERSTFYEEFVKGVSQPTHAQPGYLGLQVFAVQSGGMVLNSTNDLTSSIATCVGDASSFYVLSFEPRPPDKPNAYHSIAVRVEKPGVTVRTRNGYYDPPPGGMAAPGANFSFPLE